MKDPAVLFYFQDFLVGTEFMTDEEVGKYIRILCHQADKGALTEKQILRICNTTSIPDAIKEKLTNNGDGKYYQKRMKEERDKRIKFCEKQKENVEKRWNKNINIEDEDINENENENERYAFGNTVVKKKREVRFKIPSIEEVKAYCEERKNDVDIMRWYNFYEAKGWMIGKNKMKDWKAAVRTWERNDEKTEDKFDKLERLKNETYGK